VRVQQAEQSSIGGRSNVLVASLFVREMHIAVLISGVGREPARAELWSCRNRCASAITRALQPERIYSFRFSRTRRTRRV